MTLSPELRETFHPTALYDVNLQIYLSCRIPFLNQALHSVVFRIINYSAKAHAVR